MKAKLRVVSVEDRTFQDKGGDMVGMWVVTLADAEQRLITPFSLRLMRPEKTVVDEWQAREGKEMTFELVGTLQFAKDGTVKPGNVYVVQDNKRQPEKV